MSGDTGYSPHIASNMRNVANAEGEKRKARNSPAIFLNSIFEMWVPAGPEGVRHEDTKRCGFVFGDPD